MLDRSRRVLLSLSAASLLLFGLVLLAVVRGWGSLARFDERARPLPADVLANDSLRLFFRTLEDATGTIGMTVLTLVLAAAMFAKGHRRAAAYTLGVMAVTALATTLIKLAVGRERPEWQAVEAVLSTKSFPSGHASAATALGGVSMVLVLMLVRRSGVRRAAYVAISLAVLLISAERVLLGRHFVSDVLGGVLLAVGVVVLGLALYSPLPRSHAIKAGPLPQPYASEQRLAVVLNPIKVEDVEGFRTIVTAMAAEAGWHEPIWHYTSIEDPGTGMAEAASVAGADLVLVCGGDGTVREVCAELAGTGIPIGIIPAGTGNLLARNLGIPLFLRAAIDIALTGQDRAVDMVDVSGDGFEDTHFMVMAGMGFDAAIMQGVNEGIKSRVGWLAYVFSASKSLMFPAVRVEISIDDRPFTRHRARTIVVGNVGYLQAGMPLLPAAAIDDGLLDVVLLHPRKFLSWVPLAFRVLAKGSRTDDTINRMTGRSVIIRTSADTPRQLDGDFIGPGRELRMTCVHGRLLVRVPR